MFKHIFAFEKKKLWKEGKYTFEVAKEAPWPRASIRNTVYVGHSLHPLFPALLHSATRLRSHYRQPGQVEEQAAEGHEPWLHSYKPCPDRTYCAGNTPYNSGQDSF